ncbi:XkdX family protein [Enterococcus faecium]
MKMMFDWNCFTADKFDKFVPLSLQTKKQYKIISNEEAHLD